MSIAITTSAALVLSLLQDARVETLAAGGPLDQNAFHPRLRLTGGPIDFYDGVPSPVGEGLELAVAKAGPNGLGFLFLSLGSAPVPLPSGATFFAGSATTQIPFAVGDGFDSDTLVSTVSTPGAWAGIEVTSQAAVINPLVPGFLDVTDALRLRFGPWATAAGKLPAAATAYSGPPRASTLVDLDGDGDLDRLEIRSPGMSGSAAEPAFSRLLNDGDGRFELEVSWFDADFEQDGVLAADVDGDGRPEALTASDEAERITIHQIDEPDAAGAIASSFVALSSEPVDFAVADVDGDGDSDLVVVLAALGTVSEYLNDGAGNFTAGASWSAATVDAAGGWHSQTVRTVDVDGSGNLQYFVRRTDGTVALTSAFGVSVFISPDGAITDLDVGDVDMDGVPDVAFLVEEVDGRRAELRRSKGAPLGFPFGNLESVEVDPLAVRIRLTDMDRDGRADLILGLASGPSLDDVVVLERVADDAFGDPRAYAAGVGVAELQVADLTGDGNAEVMVTGDELALRHVLRGEPNAQLEGATRLSVGGRPIAPCAADLNGDGLLDLAALDADGGRLLSWLGDGAGGFTAAADQPLSGSGEVLDLVLGDLSGDGFADALVVLRNSIWVHCGDGLGGFEGAGGFSSPALCTDAVVGPGPDDVYAGAAFADGGESFPTGAAVAYSSFDSESSAWVTKVTYVRRGFASWFWITQELPGTEPARRGVLFEDVDGDGLPDVVVANEQVHGIFGLLGGTASTELLNTISPETALAALDADFDGRFEWLALQPGFVQVRGAVDVIGETFAPTSGPFLGFASAIGVTTGDANVDGIEDAVAWTAEGATVAGSGTGEGLYWRTESLPSGAPVRPLLVDLDGDGDDDLVVAGWSPSPALGVFMND